MLVSGTPPLAPDPKELVHKIEEKDSEKRAAIIVAPVVVPSPRAAQSTKRNCSCLQDPEIQMADIDARPEAQD